MRSPVVLQVHGWKITRYDVGLMLVGAGMIFVCFAYVTTMLGGTV